MRTTSHQTNRTPDALDLRDAIIHTLYVRLKAERETRESIAEAARHGAPPEVIEAMATDPVPPIDELGQAETVAMLLRYVRALPELRPPNMVELGD